MADPTGSDVHVPTPLGVSRSSEGLRPKAAVHYGAPTAGQGTCGGCLYFSNNSCSLVAGTISASMTCDLYALGSAKMSEPEQYFDKQAYMKAYNARRRGPGIARSAPASSTHVGGARGKVQDYNRLKAAQGAELAAHKAGSANRMRADIKSARAGKAPWKEDMTLRADDAFGRGGPAHVHIGNYHVMNTKAAIQGNREYQARVREDRRTSSLMGKHERALQAHPGTAVFNRLARMRFGQAMRQGVGRQAGIGGAMRRAQKKFDAGQGYSERVPGEARGLQSFFDKKAYMAAYNARKRGPGVARTAAPKKMVTGMPGGPKMPASDLSRARNVLRATAEKDAHYGVAFNGHLASELHKAAARPGLHPDVKAHLEKQAGQAEGNVRFHQRNIKRGGLAPASGRVTSAMRTRVKAHVAAHVEKGQRYKPATPRQLRAHKQWVDKANADYRQHRADMEAPEGNSEGGHVSSENLTLQQFFDKKAYMAAYNARKGGGGTRKAPGLGRLNRSKKITAANPSGASVGRIARLGQKTGSIAPGSSKSGILAYVKGFAKARAGRIQNEGIAKVNRMGKGRPAFPGKKGPSVPKRLVTRKGGLNPRARAPRAGGGKNQAFVRGHGYDPRGPGAG